LESEVLHQHRIEAELIAARLFRFRARRGLGVFYSLISILPILGLILYNTTPLLFAVIGEMAGILVIWFVSRLCGFGGLSRMQYSLDFLKGERGTIYDERRVRWLSWRRNLAWLLVSVWPWFGYIIANGEGYPSVAALFLVILVAELALIMRFSHSTKGDRILERRAEDWAIIVGDISIGIIAILPGAPVWTWALASPLFVICGTRSLYEAPKELALVVS
jgi:hypothetical protein